MTEGQSRRCRRINRDSSHNGNPPQYSCLENPMDRGAWQAAVHGVARSWTRLSNFTFTFHFHALEKAMATHSSVLAWRIPGTGKPGGLPSMGSHRVRYDWSDLAAAAAAAIRREGVIRKDGILQARILEWVAISFSRGSSRPRDRTPIFHTADRCFNLWAPREAQRMEVTICYLRWTLEPEDGPEGPGGRRG